MKSSVKKPTITNVITRKLIQEEYNLIGYTVFQLNEQNGKIRFGTYVLPLYEGPIYLEELDAVKRTEYSIKVTIGRPGDVIVHPSVIAAMKEKDK